MKKISVAVIGLILFYFLWQTPETSQAVKIVTGVSCPTCIEKTCEDDSLIMLRKQYNALVRKYISLQKACQRLSNAVDTLYIAEPLAEEKDTFYAINIALKPLFVSPPDTIAVSLLPMPAYGRKSVLNNRLTAYYGPVLADTPLLGVSYDRALSPRLSLGAFTMYHRTGFVTGVSASIKF